jgi:hypothetical protein
MYIRAIPDRLELGKIPINITQTQDVIIELRGGTITDIISTNLGIFRFATDSVRWDPSAGGIIHVTFSPHLVQEYNAELILVGSNFGSFSVPLNGGGTPAPVLSTNFPDGYDFGEVQRGNTVIFRDLTVTFQYPTQALDLSNFSFEYPIPDFSVERVTDIFSDADSILYSVIIAFSPAVDGRIENTLIVQARDAADLTIDLSGDGVGVAVPSVPQQAPQQATAISGPEVAKAPALSVKNGDIVVSGAPIGSSIQVYNLQGTQLKAQSVVSSTETLQTAAFPHSVYVVVVDNDSRVIFRRKVVI